jgi:hypothetical protein
MIASFEETFCRRHTSHAVMDILNKRFHPARLWGPPSLLSNGYEGAVPLRVKRLQREAGHSPPSSAEVKNAWSYTSTPTIRLHGVVPI